MLWSYIIRPPHPPTIMKTIRSPTLRVGVFSFRSALYQRPQTVHSRIHILPSSFRCIGHTASRRAVADTQLPPPKRRSFPVRILSFAAIALVFTTSGFVMAILPAFKVANAMMHPPTDEETLAMFTPEDTITRDIEDFINNHPVVRELRSMSQYSESRPYLKIPESQRGHSLTAGTLMGPGRVVVPPFTWTEQGGKSLVQIQYLGNDLCGHPGIIHGGLLATICDEGLARCCFGALPNKIGMTANLNINYRSPAPADGFVVLRAWTTKVEGRKAWVEGRLETLVGEGEKPAVLVEASALFIEPKQAAQMARVYVVS